MGVNTLHDSTPGFHGQVAISGGSYNSAGIFAQGQFARGKNVLGFSGSGAMTVHYLNPVVPENEYEHRHRRGVLGQLSARPNPE